MSRPNPRVLGASIVFIAGLAVSLPVLDVLGNNPEFFVARAEPARDAVLSALAVGLVLPLVLGAVVWGLARLHATLGTAAHVAVFAPLAAVLGFHLLRPVAGGGALAVAGAVVLAAVTTAGLWAYEPAWAVVIWGAFVPAAALAVFFLASPASRLLGGDDVGAIVTEDVRDVPVTLVVLDELPTASLLRGPDEIDDERFPNLAAFAVDAVWYRNATTVSDRTEKAIPAVLTGQRTDDETLPIAADHPVSVFTLLADSHDVQAVEPVTELCPDSVCAGAAAARAAGAPSGVGSLLSDVSLISAYTLLPPAVTDGLPRIDQAWGDFGQGAEAEATDAAGGDLGDGGEDAGEDFSLVSRMDASVSRDRRDDLRGIVAAGDGEPPAYVLHSMLPHVPFRILPSGQTVLPTPLAGLGDDEVWDDAWLARHAHAMHLLQTGFVDRMLGELFDDLRAAGQYDGGLVIVVSDHGASFEPGTERRRITAENLPQIAAVPLLVKYPDGPAGTIDRRPAEVVDVLPTILDVLGIEAPGQLDGRSLRGDPPDADERTVDGLVADPTFTVSEADAWLVAEGVREVFGEGWGGVYRSAPYAPLVGRQVDELEVASEAGFVVSVDRLDEVRDATPESDPIPGVLSGGIGYAADPGEVDLAIAFDGTVVAVGRTYDHEADRAPWLALVPPDAFREVSDVAVFRIEDGDDGAVLHPIPQVRSGS